MRNSSGKVVELSCFTDVCLPNSAPGLVLQLCLYSARVYIKNSCVFGHLFWAIFLKYGSHILSPS